MKKCFKKSLALVLTLVLVILAVPMSALFAGAATVPEIVNSAATANVFTGNMYGRSKDLSKFATFSSETLVENGTEIYATDGTEARSNKFYRWDGINVDLSKGPVVFEADVIIYGSDSATGWEVFQGYSPVKVNGHYVFVGMGCHATSYNSWSGWTFVDTANVNEEAATNALLGVNANNGGSIATLSANAYVTVKMKVVLTATGLTASYNGTTIQNITFPEGATIEPTFIWKWCKAVETDYITNVKIYGDGVVIPENMATQSDVSHGIMKGRSKDLSATATFSEVTTAEWGETAQFDAKDAFNTRANRFYRWDNLFADVNDGEIVFEADVIIYGNDSATGWEVFQGYSPVKVNGHYVFVGMGCHATSYNSWSGWTFVDTANVNEEAATNALLGVNANNGGSIASLSADTATTVKMKVVLTATGLTASYNGTTIQNITFPEGATIEPTFIWKWDKAVTTDYITNVKIYGDGVKTAKDYTFASSDNTFNNGSASYSFAPITGEATELQTFGTEITNVGLTADDSYVYEGTMSINKIPVSGSTPVWTARIVLGHYRNTNPDSSNYGGEETLYFMFLPYWCQSGVLTTESGLFDYIRGTGDPRLWDGDTTSDNKYEITSGVELGCSTNYSSYTYKVVYDGTTGLMDIYVNGVPVPGCTDWNIRTDMAGFRPAFGGMAVIGHEGSETNDDMLAAGLSVKFDQFKILADNLKQIDAYQEADGNVWVADLDATNNKVALTVEAAEGYMLEAGSLMLGDYTIINSANAAGSDGYVESGNTYTGPYSAGEISVSFLKTSVQSVSTGVLGAQLHRDESDNIDGARFLTRFYIGDLKGQAKNIQTANGLTVTYGGVSCTVADYGIICERAERLNGAELTLENYWKRSSGIDIIKSYTDEYIDMSVVLLSHNHNEIFLNRDYTFKGYVTLLNGETIYTDAFTVCVNDFVA